MRLFEFPFSYQAVINYITNCVRKYIIFNSLSYQVKDFTGPIKMINEQEIESYKKLYNEVETDPESGDEEQSRGAKMMKESLNFQVHISLEKMELYGKNIVPRKMSELEVKYYFKTALSETTI